MSKQPQTKQDRTAPEAALQRQPSFMVTCKATLARGLAEVSTYPSKSGIASIPFNTGDGNPNSGVIVLFWIRLRRNVFASLMKIDGRVLGSEGK